MANRTESVVSGAGMLLSLITALVELVKEFGGNMEDIYRLITAEGRETLRSVARLIAGNSKPKRYKNWPAICELGKRDHLMMLAIATLDLSKEKTLMMQIIAAFPQLFSETEILGLVPWSILKDETIQQTLKDRTGSMYPGLPDPSTPGYDPNYPLMMACRGVLKKYHIPYQEFCVGSDAGNDDNLRRGILPLPDNIPLDVHVGTTVEWQGKKWIVVENRMMEMPDDDICIAPIERIALDL